MLTERLLLRVSDLLEWQLTSSLPWFIEVVVRKAVLPDRDVSRQRQGERGLPRSDACFQPDLHYLQRIRQGPVFRLVLPWKIVFHSQATKMAVC